MSKKHKTNIDLDQNQLINASIHKTFGAPTLSPTSSQIYYDTFDDKMKYYGNGIWRVPAVIINDLEDVSLSNETTDNRLSHDGSTWVNQAGVYKESELAEYEGRAVQQIGVSGDPNPTPYIPITWNSVFQGSNYTLFPDFSNIQFNNSGIYEIYYCVTVDITNNSRSTPESRIVLNGVDITRSHCYSYCRTAASGEGTMSKKIRVQISSGDVISIESRRLSGGANVFTVLNGCSLSLTKLT